MNILALNNYVILSMIQPPKEDFCGLVLPDSAEKNPRWGLVEAAGPGVVDLGGNVIPLDVAPGDTVYVAAHGKERLPTETLAAVPEAAQDLVEAELHAASILDVLGKMDGETFVPLGAYIVIEKIESPQERAGIKFADGMKSMPNFGRVKKLGMGWKTVDGREIPFQVSEGDIVAYLPFQTMVVDMSALGRDEVLHLIQHASILGKVRV